MIWDANGIATDGAQDGLGNWGATATFFNPLTGVEQAPGNGDISQFGNGGFLSAPAVITFTASESVLGLAFGATGANGYSLTGGTQTLTIGTSGITMNVGAQASLVGSTTLSIGLGGAETWTNNSASLLTVAGAVATSGTSTLTLSATSAGGITITGVVGGSAAPVTVNSTGLGIVTLSGANTETGATTLTAGILRATNATALGAGTSALTLTGGTLQLAGGLGFGRNTTVSGAVTIQSDGTSQTGAGSVGSTDTLGTLSLNASTLTITAGELVASGTAGVTFGAGTLSAAGTINTNNSFFGPNPFSSASTTGTTIVETTTLASLTATTAATAAVFGGTGNTTITGGLTSATNAVGTVTKNSTGTLTLGGASTDSGAITINAGSIVLSGGTFSAANALTFGSTSIGSGVFNDSFPAAGATQAMGALSFLGGGNTVQATNNGGTDSLTFTSLVALGAGGGATGNFVISGGTAGTNKIVLTGQATGYIGAGTFFNGGDFAYYDGTGFVRAPVYGTDAGFTNVASGVATQLTTGTGSGNQIFGPSFGATASGSAGTVIETAAATINSLKLNGAGATLAANGQVTIQNAATNTRGGIIATGGAESITGPGGISTGVSGTNSTGDLVVDVPNLSDSLLIATQILSTTTGGLTVTGNGTLFLSNPTNLVGVNNGFAGNIWIDNATLSIAGTGTSDPTTLGAAGARTLFFNGGTFQLTGTNGMYTTTKTLQVNQAGGTLDVGSSVFTLAILGQTAANFLTGAGNLTIGGNTTSAGLVFLNDASNLTGNIYLNSGTLRLGSYSNAAGSGVIIVGSGATLDVAFPGIANTAGTTGAIANALILNGAGLGAGLAASGALQNSSPFTTYFTGGITLAGNTTIGANGAGNILETGTIIDNGAGFGLTKNGISTLILAGATNFGGNTTISQGTLEIGDGSTAGSVQGNILDNGSLVFNRTDNAIYFSGSITGSGSVTQGASTGTLILNGQNTYSGPTNVNSGGTLSTVAGALAGTLTINVGTTTSSQLDFYAGGSGATIALAAGANLNLGGTSSVGRLGFLVGSTGNYDSVVLSGGGSVAIGPAGAQIAITPLVGFTPAAGVSNSYTLINAPGGISGGPITLSPAVAASLATGYKEALVTNQSAGTVTLIVSAAPSGNFYWQGGGTVPTSWYANTSLAAPQTTNWTTNPAGGLDAGITPGALDTVNFSASSISGSAPLTTTLDQSFSILGLVVNNGNTGALTINPGSFNGTLTLGTGGITVQSGGPASTTINANVAMGASQAWAVSPGSTLAVNGNISGSGFSITAAGGGTLSLGGYNTFTGGVVLSAGTLNINNGGATSASSALGVTGAFVVGAVSGTTAVTIDNTSLGSQLLLTGNPQTWNQNFIFNGSQSLSFPLTGAGAITMDASRMITVNGSTLAETGVIGGSGFSLTKAGPGVLTLGAVNTFTGGFNLTAGTLNLNSTQPVGAAAGTFVISGGTTIDNTTGGALTMVSNPMTWSGSFAFGGSSAYNLGAGAVAAGAGNITITVNSPGLGVNTDALTVAGAISGSGGLTKAGPGALILTGANATSLSAGNITVNAGTLVIGNANALGVVTNQLIINGGAIDTVTGGITEALANPQQWKSNFAFLGSGNLIMGGGNITLSGSTVVTALANTLTLGGAIQNTNTPGLTVNGSGVIALTGANLYTGATTVNPGSTLNIGAAGTTGSLASTALILDGGTFTDTRITTNNTQTFATTTLNSGASAVIANVATVDTVALGAITRNIGGTVNFTTTGNVSATNMNDAGGILGGWATVGGGANWAVGSTAGAATNITAFGAYTTTSAAGTTAANYNGQEIDVTGSVAPLGNITPDSLRFSAVGPFTLTLAAGVNSITSGGILTTPTETASSTIAGGTLTSGALPGAANGDLIFNQFGAGNLIINSVIADNNAPTATTALTKSGTGAGITIIGGSGGALAGTVTNTFSGGIYINAGILQADGTNVSGGNASTGALGANAITLNGGTLALDMDGDATGSVANVSLGNAVTVNGSAAITANRLAAGNPIGSASLFLTALNKDVQFGALTMVNAGATLTISPSNGYGVEFTGITGGININQALTTLLVNTNGATTSNATPSLILSGVVTDSNNWTKAGTGTLLLNNLGNASTLTGNALVMGGVLAFTGNNAGSALGAAANVITLNGGGIEATNATVSSVGSPASNITIGNQINFFGAAANNIIGVANNTTLTLTSAFGPNNIGFNKIDDGALVLGANNALWSGAVVVNAGVVELTNSSALGIGSIQVGATGGVANVVGAAIQLFGGITIANPININAGTNTGIGGLAGIDGNGSLESVSGNNTITAALTAWSQDAGIGADAGSTLNITGGIPTVGHILDLGGAGNINLTTNPVGAIFGITKLGSGILTIQTTVGVISTNSLNINAGFLVLSGAGKLSLGSSDAVLINPGGTLTVDDSIGLPVANRLAGNAMTLAGGAFNYTGSSIGNSTEIIGALTPGAGFGTITITAGSNLGAAVTAASIGTVATGDQILIRGTNLGSAGGINAATFATTTGPTFVGAAGLTGTPNKGILPWAIVDTSATGLGVSFATSDSVTGTTGGGNAIWRPLASTEYVTSMASGYQTTVNNLVFNSAQTVLGSFTDNSLNLASGGGLTIDPMQTLTLSSGGVLLQSGNTGIGGGFLSSGGAMYFFAPTSSGGLTTIGSTILNSSTTAGINFAAGNGTVSLTSFEPYTAPTTVNQGTLQLAAGTNTIVVGVASSGQPLVVNIGGAVDLDGNAQLVGSLSSTQPAVAGGSTGGTITTSVAAAIFATNTTAASAFSGTIGTGSAGATTGNSLSFVRSGAATLNLLGNNTYTGTTLLEGSTTTLRDFGTLAGTSSIAIDYAGLTIDNTGYTDMPDRVNDSAGITLRGGALTFLGRSQTVSSETVGAVTLDQGLSTITALAGGIGVSSADLTLASLSRTAGSPAVVSFTGTNLGMIGSNGRVNISGATPASLATAGTMINNIIPWATVTNVMNITTVATSATVTLTSGTTATLTIGEPVAGSGIPAGELVASILSPTQFTITTGTGVTLVTASTTTFGGADFASYIAYGNGAGGIGALNSAGYAGYDFTLANTFSGYVPSATANLKITALGTVASVPTGVTNANSLNLVSTATGGGITFTNATDTIDLTSGGLLHSGNFTASIGGSAGNGELTAGGPSAASGTQDLYIINTATTALTINANVIDTKTILGSGAAVVRLDLTNSTTGGITLAGTGNAYSGGTVVNGGTVTLTGNLPAGGITLNGGALTQTTGTIASQAVTLNGSSTLTTGATTNTLTTLTFNNNGGATAPALAAGPLNLTGGQITAFSMNPAVISTLSSASGAIDIGAGVMDITANPITANGLAGGPVISPYAPTLNISATLQSQAFGATGSLLLNGNGILELSGANTFTGGVALNAGGIYLASAQGLGLTTSGAGGVLTVAGNNTSLTGTAVTAVNPIVINSGVSAFTIGNYGGAAMTLSGIENWNTTGALTLTTNAVNGATFNTQTLSGVIFSGSGLTSLIKNGPDTLALSGVNQGTLNLTGANAIQITGGVVLTTGLDAAFGMVPASPVANNIDVDGGVLNLGSTNFMLNPNRGITLGSSVAGANTGFGTLANNGSGAVIPGVVTGGNLIVDSTIVTLAGGNTYTGTTTVTVDAFWLAAANSNALGPASTTLAASANGTLVTGLSSTLGLVVGESVTGVNILPGTTVAAINSGSSITLSQAAGAAGGTSLTISGGAVYVLNGSGLGIDNSADGGAGGASVGGGIIIGNKTLHLNGVDLINGIAQGALQNISGPNTYGGPIILDSNSEINSASGLLVLTNTITGSNAYALTLGGAGNLQISGVIGSSVANLLKIGSGFDILGGINAYSGQTNIYSGILRLQNSAALGASAVTAFAGASLELDGTSANGNLAVSNPVTIEGFGLVTLSGVGANPGTTGGALRSSGGSNTYSGAITLGTAAQINSDVAGGNFTLTGGVNGGGFALTIAGSGNTTISGAGISGAGATLTKLDDGVLTLNAAGSYTGATAINGGVVILQNSGGFGSSPSIAVALGAALDLQTSLGAIPLTLNGNGLGTGGQTGALASTGTNTYSGLITLASNAAISSDSGTLSLSNTGAGAISGASVTLGTTAASTSSSTLTVSSTAGLVAGQTVTGAGIAPGTTIVSITSPTQLVLSTTDSVANSTPVTFSSSLTLAGAGQGGISGGIATGVGAVTMNGSGSWTLSGSSTYTGATTINAGLLTLAGTNTSTGAIVNGGTLALNLSTNTAGVLTASPALTLGGGTLSVVGAAGVASSQTMGNFALTAGSVSAITINPNSGPGTTLTLGSNWTRGADSILDVNIATSGSVLATTGSAGTTGATGTNNIYGDMLVTDSGGTGLGQLVIGSPNVIQRFNSQAFAATLTPASNVATTDYTTFGSSYVAPSSTTTVPTASYSGGVLDWSNGGGLGPRAVNSLTIDTSGNTAGSGYAVFLGGDSVSSTPATLTIASGALVFQGTNSETIYGGQVGAPNSELDIHQLGGGTLTIGSNLISSVGATLSGTVGNTTSITGLPTTAGLFIGEPVYGSNIPVGATVTNIVNGTSITISAASAAPSTGVPTALTFGPGSGSLVKDGSGTLVISGPSSQIGVLSGITVSSLATGNLYVGEQVAGIGIPSGDTIASIGATSVTLVSAATTANPTTLTFGTQNGYSGATVIDGGLVQTASINALSPNSAITLANVSGAVLDLNGFDQMVGSISGGGSNGGNILLTNGATLTIGAGMGTVGGSINENVNLGNPESWNTYAGQLSGTGSLTLTGGSTLYLTNNSNSYTGFTDILSGTLVISNMGQLGNSTTTVTVGGPTSVDQPQGILVLQGGATGLTVNRNIDVSGFGSGQTNIGQIFAFNSIGNNTFTGIITSAAQDTRVEVTGGTTIFSSSSTLNLGASASNGFLFTGSGNLLVNGLVSGGGAGLLSFYRWNAGTIVGDITLDNPNNNFISDVNVVANLVITTPGALGVGTDATSIRSNGGILELRVDPVYTNFGIKTLNPTGSATMFAGRSVGGAGINQTLIFGGGTTVNGVVIQGFNDSTNAGLTPVFNSIDGYGISAGPGTGGTITMATSNNDALTSNMDGLLTLNGSLSSADTTARVDTITATGDVLLTGNLLDASAGLIGDHVWTKAGAGTLAIQGTLSTEVGAFNITNGTVAINAMGALNSNTAGGGVLIGSTTNSGFLNYLGASGTGAGEVSIKAIILGGTTGNGVVFANQQQSSANTAPSALTLSSSIAATGVGAKTLYLEGYNGSTNTAIVNQISGVIQDNTAVNTTGLLKGGNGTWLYAPTAASYASAAQGAPNAELTSAVNSGAVLTFNSTAGLAVGQVVTGTNIAANTFISSLSGTQVTLSAAPSGAVASGAEIGFAGEASTASTLAPTVTLAAVTGAATLTLSSTTGLTVGQAISGTGIPAADFITAINAGTGVVTLNAVTTGAVALNAIVAIDGVASTNVITIPSVNAAALVVGETVSGVNVPAGTVVTAINGTNVTLNNNIATAIAAGTSLYFGSVGPLAPFAPSTAALPATVATNAATATGATLPFTSTAGLAVGQLVTGTNIPANTYILSISQNTSVTLSQSISGAVASGASIAFAGEFETAATTGGGAATTNSVTLGSTAGLVAGETVEGANIPAGALIASISGNTVFLTTTITTAVTTATPLYFGNIAGSNALGAGAGENFTGAVTVAGGTLQIQPTANSGNGSAPLFATPGSTTTNNIVFATDPLTGNGYAGGTFQLIGSTAAGTLTTSVGQLIPTAGQGNIVVTTSGSGAPTLDFMNTTPVGVRGGGGILNFQPGVGTIEFNSNPTTNGIIGGYAFFTNATTQAVDFATVTAIGAGGTAPFVVGAPVYGVTGSFLNALPVSGSTSTVNYLSSVSVATTAIETVNSLKLSGAQTLTLGGALTLGTGGLLFDNSNGAALIQSSGSSANGIGAPTATVSVTTTASSATVNLTSGTTAGFYVGMPFTFSGNANIPATDTVASIVSATQFTLASATSVGAGTGVSTIVGNETMITVAGSMPGNALTISAPIGSIGVGPGSVTKDGSGTLVISGSNFFTGDLNLDGGTIQLSGANATLGAITTVGNVTSVRQGATLDINAAGPGDTTTIGALAGAGTVTNSGGGSLSAATLNIGYFGVTSATSVFSGLLQDGGNASVLNVTKNGSGIEYLNPLTGATSSTSPTGQTLGTLGYNTYSGVTNIAQGTLSVTSLANYGSLSAIGTGLAQSNAASLVLGTNATTGILQYVGGNQALFLQALQSPSLQTNRLFTLAGNGGLDSSGGYGNGAAATAITATATNNAALWFTNTAPVAFSTGGSKVLTLQGSSIGDNEIDLQLINNTIDGSPLSVTKAGVGTWILGNTNNTYSGVTTISGGALRAQDAGSNATSGITIASSVTSNILTLASSNGLSIGQSVSGAGIAAGTSIVSILSPTQIQLSTTPATVASGVSLAFGSINSLSPNSNLVLNGGVLETSGVFSRSLGSGAGQVQWLSGTAAGGFAAASSPLIVAIGGVTTPTPLVFGTASFTTGTFQLGSSSALSNTTVLNPIDLNGATRTISVTDDANTTLDYYTLAGVISGRTSGLNLSSTPVMIITGANTYSGNTTLGGNFVVSSIGSGGPSSAFGDSTGQLLIGTGGTGHGQSPI